MNNFKQWLVLILLISGLILAVQCQKHTEELRLVEQVIAEKELKCIGWYMDISFLDDVVYDSTCTEIHDIAVTYNWQTKYFTKDEFLGMVGL